MLLSKLCPPPFCTEFPRRPRSDPSTPPSHCPRSERERAASVSGRPHRSSLFVWGCQAQGTASSRNKHNGQSGLTVPEEWQLGITEWEAGPGGRTTINTAIAAGAHSALAPAGVIRMRGASTALVASLRSFCGGAAPKLHFISSWCISLSSGYLHASAVGYAADLFVCCEPCRKDDDNQRKRH